MKERGVVLSPAAERDRPGLRIIGFERRLTIAFMVQEETVTVLRVFTAGRNWETSF